MSIFRNRVIQRPQPYYEDDAEMEPRLFPNAQEHQDDMDYEQGDGPYRSSNLHPHPQRRRSARVEDMHPRELSFWREERLYEDYDRQTRQASPLRFILVVTSLIIISVFAWIAFRWVSAPTEGQPRLIYADPQPYKTRPEASEGSEDQYKNRLLIYDKLAPGAEQKVRFLPPQEQPMTAPQQQNAAPQGSVPQQDYNSAQQQQGYNGQAPQDGGAVQQQPYQQAQQQVYYQQPQQLQQPQPPQAVQEGKPQQPPYPQARQQNSIGQQTNVQQVPAPQPIQVESDGRSYEAPQHGQNIPVVQGQKPPQVAKTPLKPSADSAENLIDEALKEESDQKSASKVVSKKPDKNKKAGKPIPLSSKSYRVQVATLANEKAAVAELGRIRRSQHDLVGTLQSGIQSADDNSGAYRVIFGPFKTRKDAIQRCSEFRRHGISCIILNPKP